MSCSNQAMEGVVKRELFLAMWTGLGDPAGHSRDLSCPRKGRDRVRVAWQRQGAENEHLPSHSLSRSSSPLAKPSQMLEGKGTQESSLRDQRLVSRSQSGI